MADPTRSQGETIYSATTATASTADADAVLRLNQTQLELNDVLNFLETAVASHFHQNQGGQITVWTETTAAPNQYTVSLNEPQQPRTFDKAIYLEDIAQLLDDVIVWLNKPEQSFRSMREVMQALGEPPFNGSRPATRFGFIDANAPTNQLPSHKLLFDQRQKLYEFAEKTLTLVRIITDQLTTQDSVASKHLEYLYQSAQNANGIPGLRELWPSILQLAQDFSRTPAGELFFTTPLSNAPVAVVEAKIALNAFTLKLSSVPRSIVFVVADDKELLEKFELAEKFPEDQLIVDAFITFFTDLFADNKLAAAAQAQDPAELAKLLDEESISNYAATLQAAGETAADTTGDATNATTASEPTAQTRPETATQSSAQPQTIEQTDTSLENTSSQLRTTAAWIQGVALSQLFANTTVELDKLPIEVTAEVLTESMSLLAGLSPDELRNPAIRHQVFDKLMLRLKANPRLSAQLQILYTEYATTTHNPTDGKALVDNLEQRAEVAMANEEQRQQLTTELDKLLPPLAQAKAAFPANFEKEMAELTDFNQQGLGPNTVGFKNIVTTIDQLIFVQENQDFLELLTPEEFNQLFQINLTAQQVSIIKPKLEGYWMMRVGQLESGFQIPSISQNLPPLLAGGVNGIPTAARNYRVRARFRQLDQLRNPNLPLGQNIPPQDLILASAATAQQHKLVVFAHYLKLSPEQSAKAMATDDSKLNEVLTQAQLDEWDYHKKLRQSLLNEFFAHLDDEQREMVYQQVGFAPGQLYDASLYDSYSKLQQQQLQMLANDSLGGTRRRGLRGALGGLFRRNKSGYDKAAQLTGKASVQAASYLADLVVPGLGASIRGGLQTLRVMGMGRVADSIERNIGKGIIVAVGVTIGAEIAAMLLAARSVLGQIGYMLGGSLFGTAGRLGGALLGDYLSGTRIGRLFEGAANRVSGVFGGNDNGRGGAINPELAPTTANLVTPTVRTTSAITSRASQLLGTQAGQIFIATTGTIGAVTIVSFMTINGAFQTNLPTVDSAGEVSPFVTITKQAYDSADNAINQVNNFSEPATFRYKILIEPKDGYTLTIDDVTDKLTYTFTDTNQKREPTVRDKAAFGLTPEAPTKVLNPADDDTANDFWLIEYDQTIDPLSDASARNTIEIHFTATKTGEADATETATSGFKLCVGECPKNEGDGCWPAYGVILQEPYGSYSHSKVDAVDIAYSKLVTNGQSDEKTITSPISGQACFYVKETGIPAREERCGHVYGNHVVVASEDFALVYGHLHQPTSKYEYGSCYPIEAGEPIGVMGTSGCSDGVHLHYEVRLRVKGGDTFGSFTSAIPGQPGPVTTLLETLVPGEQIKLNSTIPDKCQPARP